MQGESDAEESGRAHEVVVCESNSLADRRYHTRGAPGRGRVLGSARGRRFCGALPPTSATMPHFSIVWHIRSPPDMIVPDARPAFSMGRSLGKPRILLGDVSAAHKPAPPIVLTETRTNREKKWNRL